MIKIEGTYNEAIVYTDDLEPGAKGQLRTLCNQDFLARSKIRVMPDVHEGKGCTIGTTMTIQNKAIPYTVGVDIGCGILTIVLKEDTVNLSELDNFIRKNIPHGVGRWGTRKRPHRGHGRIDVTELRCWDHIKRRKTVESLGTLGSGNHYIEMNTDNEGILYLQIHSGSRNPGLQVAEYYQKVAYDSVGGKDQFDVPFELAYVSGQDFANYIHDMKLMQEFAALNRRIMANDIIEHFKWKEDYRFDTIHNYIDTENMILRKGACAAYKDQLLIIPMNMRDGSLICRGKGNPEWNYSAPHGAGRKMSRKVAKNSISMSEYKESMEGIFTSCISNKTVDEAPMAYKPMDDIIANMRDTVDIVKRITPIYNFKAE